MSKFEYETRDYNATQSSSKMINFDLIKIINEMRKKGWIHYNTVVVKSNYKLFFRRKNTKLILR